MICVCGHSTGAHERACRIRTCSCRKFRLAVDRDQILSALSTGYFRIPRGTKDLSPEELARALCEEDPRLDYGVLLADIVWNPGLYYDDMVRFGGRDNRQKWLNKCRRGRLTC